MEVAVTTGAVDVALSVVASLSVAASLSVMTGPVTSNAVRTAMEAAAEVVEAAEEVEEGLVEDWAVSCRKGRKEHQQTQCPASCRGVIDATDLHFIGDLHVWIQ